MSEQVCGNCCYHFQGACRRYPPISNGQLGSFVMTPSNCWCGEWKSTTSPGARKPDPLPNGFREIESKFTDQKPVFLPEKESDGSQDATSDQH